MRKTTNPFKKHPLLYGITAIIFVISLIGLAVILLPNPLKIGRDILFVISAIYLLVSFSFFLWISLRDQDQELVGVLPKTIEELKRVGREYYRNTAAIEENSARVDKLHNGIEQEIGELIESNKSIAKELMELRQEKGNCQRELNNWYKSAIDFFQTLERGLETEKNHERLEVIEKNIREFEMLFNNRGLYRIIPSINGKFDETQHEFKGEEISSELEDGSILKCNRWGYRLGEKVLQPAAVILAKKPESLDFSE
ncbi:nucleotide exchange factor GrpE [Anabaena sp. UHCC 0187]|uniref:nucleotide exchange factor GrpE n=1 Tax=Anabaena sp. UHCC 0187 TaxID=2590018 RepID=UPI001446E46B|nr:nucleotide exchange factor GrpE [Anabaena sp. UHCC 0187]MTJ14622.1 nucleotide exchange factor GrpE [Anabaena sp. UHCC 0187]